MHSVTKTVVIGLGGSGLLGVLHTKKRLIDVYGEVPPTYKFLVFDTAPQIPLDLPDGQIRLEDGVEFHHLTVEKVKNVVKHEDIAAWFDPTISVSTIKNGAGQKRHVGRISFFRHYPYIRAALEGALKGLLSFTVDAAAKGKYRLADEQISVYLICSIAGGTGAGCFLDMGFVLRDVFPDNTPLRALLVLPDVYHKGAFFTDRVNMNAYGALLELDQWMNVSPRTAEDITIANDVIRADEPPFDWVVLIGDRGRGDLAYDNPKQIAEMIGLSIFTLTSAVGEQVDSVWDNAKDSLTRFWKSKKTSYCGLGVAELVYDPSRVIGLREKTIARQIVAELSGDGEGEGGVEEMVERFIEVNKLKEASRDDVIDAVLEPARAMPFRKDLTKRNHESVTSQCEQWLAVRSADYKKKAAVAAKNLIAEKSGVISAQVRHLIHQPSGPSRAGLFLERLSSFLTAYKGEMENEKHEFNDQLTRLKKDRAALVNKLIPEAAEKLFGNDFPDLTLKLSTNMTRASQALYENARRDGAIDVYTALIDLCGQGADNAAKLKTKLGLVLERLTAETVKLERVTEQPKPFSITMTPDIGQIETIATGTEAFLAKLDESGLNIADLAGKSDREIERLLLEHIHNLGSAKDLRRKGLDQVFADMLKNDPAAAQEWIKKLDRSAEPLLRYFDDLRPSDEPTSQTLYVVGVESGKGSVVLEDSRLKDLFKAHKAPSAAATNDPTRIIVLKFEAAVPAFALEGVKRYREDYMKARQNRAESVVIYHLSRTWYEDKFNYFENEYDLMPIEEESANRRFWSVALALSSKERPLIYNRANNYYIIDRDCGRPPDYEVLLGNSRENARASFLAREDLLESVKKQIDDIIKQQGPDAIRSVLTSYLDDRLRPKVPARSSRQADLRRVMLDEVRDLESFTAEL